MNKDIKQYPTFIFYDNQLLPAEWITSTASYNHFAWQLHHYIKKGDYKRNQAWYDERGIKQKLILLPIYLHLAVHSSPASPNISDEQFEEKFKISKWNLLFNRKKWREGFYG